MSLRGNMKQGRFNFGALKSKCALKKTRHMRTPRVRCDNFDLYILRLLKKIWPEMQISSNAKRIMNSFINDSFDRIAAEAANLLPLEGVSTLKCRHIRNASQLHLRGSLATHAIINAEEAMQKFNHSKDLVELK